MSNNEVKSDNIFSQWTSSSNADKELNAVASTLVTTLATTATLTVSTATSIATITASSTKVATSKVEVIAPTAADHPIIEAKSIWVGNVDYGTSLYELEEHFQKCGPIVRATILHDKYSGRAKGFAYVEFVNADSVELALTLNDTLLRGRQIKINAKRLNVHGLTTTNGRYRGRGGERRRGESAVRRGRSRYYDQQQHPASRGVGRGRSWRTSRNTPY